MKKGERAQIVLCGVVCDDMTMKYWRSVFFLEWSSFDDDEGAARSISIPNDAESLQRLPFSLSFLLLVRRLPLVAHIRSCCMHTGRVMLTLLLLLKRPCSNSRVGVLPPVIGCHFLEIIRLY